MAARIQVWELWLRILWKGRVHGLSLLRQQRPDIHQDRTKEKTRKIVTTNRTDEARADYRYECWIGCSNYRRWLRFIETHDAKSWKRVLCLLRGLSGRI
jgi:hypothetical protein